MGARPNEPIQQRRVGRYRLGRRIGAGGMAAVFAARREQPGGLGRLVALKVMSTALLGDPASEAMFLREASIAARLEHPNIVRVYEVDEADGTLFIAMEHIDGHTLRRLWQEGPLPLDMAIQIVIDVGRGLHAAHELLDDSGQPLGLVHQDVTPHNVMVTFDGVTKLLDFGVARLGAIEGSRTQTVRGKPNYLAPEQLNGERLDRRTDIFALGAVLFELVTGEQLFEAGLASDTKRQPRKLRDVAPHIPEAIATACDRALAIDPDDRFDDVVALCGALAEARRDAALSVVEPERIGRWIRDVAPPLESPRILAREIVGPSSIASTSSVAELPTARQPRVNPGSHARLPGPPSTTKRLWIARIALVCFGGLAYFALHAVGLFSPTPDAPEVHLAELAPPPDEPSAEPRAVASSSGSAHPDLLPSAHNDRLPPAPPPPRAPVPRQSAPSGGPAPTTAPSLAPDPTPPPLDPAAVATLVVGSNEWGSVAIDGAPVGNSPVSIPVAVGGHSVTIQTPDGKTQSRSVTAKAGQTHRLRFVF